MWGKNIIINILCGNIKYVYIPMYNIEKYITKCMQSLFAQTLDNIEYKILSTARKTSFAPK